MASTLINKTTQVGPYPGRTWEQEAAAVKNGLFGFVVHPKRENDKCDRCMKPNSPEYKFCSKQCNTAAIAEARSVGRAEARGS